MDADNMPKKWGRCWSLKGQVSEVQKKPYISAYPQIPGATQQQNSARLLSSSLSIQFSIFNLL